MIVIGSGGHVNIDAEYIRELVSAWLAMLSSRSVI